MARIDALLARLEKMGGESVLLAAGKPAQLMVGGKANLLAPVLTEETIASLLAEVMPPGEKAGYDENGFAEFPHRAVGGQSASVIAEKSPKGLVVRFDRVLPEDAAMDQALEEEPLEEAELVEPPGGGVDMSLPDAEGVFELEGVRAAGIPLATAVPAPAPGPTPAKAAAPVAAAPASAVAAPETAKKLVTLLRTLLENGGSDLHVSAGSPPRLRVHGRLVPLKEPPTTAEASAAMVGAILDEKQRARFAAELSVDFSFDLGGVGRFRANAVRQRHGCSLVFRAIPDEIPSMASLGLPPVVETLTRYPNGLILVTGPAGCGKSTTLASILDHVNATWKDHVITVEDPVEFVYPARSCLVNQREVGTHVRTFAEALRSALREDPDVILVGELRDLETIQLAITAAETGHLVLGTLHTVDAGKTVERLIDVFPGSQKGQIRAMVSESIRGVISQQLVPAADGKGRVAAFEILVGDRSIANLIRESKTFQIPNAIRLGRARGMQSMDDALADLVASGKVAAEVALAHTESPDSLKKLLGAPAAAPPSGSAPAARKATPNAGR